MEIDLWEVFHGCEQLKQRKERTWSKVINTKSKFQKNLEVDLS